MKGLRNTVGTACQSHKNLLDVHGKNNLSLLALQRKNFKKNQIKNQLISSLQYNMNIEDTDEDMTIPSEDVKVSNVLLTSNSLSSCKTLSLMNSTVKSIPITTPRNGNYSSTSLLSESLNSKNSKDKSKYVENPTIKCNITPQNSVKFKNDKNYKKYLYNNLHI